MTRLGSSPNQYVGVGLSLLSAGMALPAWVLHPTPHQLAASIDTCLKVAQLAALAAAAWWFFKSSGASKRTQLDVAAKVCAKVPDGTLLEVTVLLENKGFVTHKLYDLNLTVKGASSAQRFSGYEDRNKKQYPHKAFDVTILDEARLISPDPNWEWMFVRPGTRQAVTRLVLVQTNINLVAIIAQFTYRSERRVAENMPHSALKYINLDEPQCQSTKT